MKLRAALFLLISVGLIVAQQSNSPAPARQSKAAAKAAVTAPAGFAATVQPFLEKNCYGCHNAKLSSGSLDLTQYKTDQDVQSARAHLERAIERLKAGEMPPPGMPRPDAAAQAKVVQYLESEFARLDASTPVDPGRVTVRRLNRAEYNNTVRDLLGVDYKPADDFPQDDSGYGFDTIGDVLSLSVVQVEKYMNAAEDIARTAIYGPEWAAKPVMSRYQPNGRRRPGDFDSLFFNTHPYLSIHDYDETGLTMPNSFHVKHYFPVTADYTFRMTPDNGNRPPGSMPLQEAAFVDGVQVGTMEVDGELEGETREVRAHVEKGEHWVAFGFPKQFEGLPVAYGGDNPSTRPVPQRGRRGGFGANLQPPPNATPEQLAAFEARRKRIQEAQAAQAANQAPPNDADQDPAGLAAPPGGAPLGPPRGASVPAPNRAAAAPKPGQVADPAAAPGGGGRRGGGLQRPDNVGIQSVEIVGPFNAEIRPSQESTDKVYVCGKDGAGRDFNCVQKIVNHLARLAYRRPPTSKEIGQIMALATRARDRGDSFQEQLVVAIEAILVSPHFLFRIEQNHANTAAAAPRSTFINASAPAPASGRKVVADSYQLDDYELASRLSYFLWASMPDSELLDAADKGSLHNPELLNAQVRRMLADPKISRFVKNFGGQWLQTRALETHRPDFYKYPQYDNRLQYSMEQETQLFFENLIHEDGNILDFLDSDYTFVNEPLGEFYGLRQTKGWGLNFRKVSLEGTPRRGLLGQASILAVTSYPNRTSVVLRGKWVLENLLNTPPPPPPPNVPDLDQASVGEDATLRQRMEAHRSNAICASCHSRMDPIGFGLENFDAVGLWRDKDGKSDIDASGTLPDGTKFDGPAALAKLLRQTEPDKFAKCLIEKMMTYGLGRGIEPYDRPVIDRIAQSVKADNYRFSSVVLGIVDSIPFQMRRGDRGKI